jgi:hypothetical protein
VFDWSQGPLVEHEVDQNKNGDFWFVRHARSYWLSLVDADEAYHKDDKGRDLLNLVFAGVLKQAFVNPVWTMSLLTWGMVVVSFCNLTKVLAHSEAHLRSSMRKMFWDEHRYSWQRMVQKLACIATALRNGSNICWHALLISLSHRPSSGLGRCAVLRQFSPFLLFPEDFCD